MDWEKYLKYAVIGVAGYYVLAKAGVFGERSKESPFKGFYEQVMSPILAPILLGK